MKLKGLVGHQTSFMELQANYKLRAKYVRERWPKSRGAYLKFVLCKTGVDTVRCLDQINDKLRSHSNKTFS